MLNTDLRRRVLHSVNSLSSWGFFMSKKLERMRSELLSEDKITNLLGFLTKQNPGR
jgi:hypothetical protein